MAGPMVGPLLERLGLELIETYWTPDGNFPDHEPNPLLPENRQFIIEQVRETRRRPRDRLGRRRRPLLLHRRHRRVRRRRLPHGAARRVAAAQEPRRGDPLRRARLARGAGHGHARPAARRTSTASGTRSSRRACARRARCSAARSPATTTSATSTAPTPARSRRCSCSSCSRARARRMSRAARALPLALLHLRRDQLRGRRPAGEDRGDRRALLRRRAETPRRDLDRLRGLALQRAPVEHRAAAAPVPGVARLARGHGAPPRRGARADPLVSDAERDAARRRAASSEQRAARARRPSRHPSPGDPDAVSRRARQRLPDRGLAADADRLRAQLGARRWTSSSRRWPALGHAVEDIELLVDQPPAHRPLRPRGDPRAALRRRGRGARRAGAVPGATTATQADARRPLRRGA